MLQVAARSASASRWIARAPRLALGVACVALTAAGLRATFAPTPAPLAGSAAPTTPRADVQSQALAEAFTRAYLTWDGGDASDRKLARFGTTVEAPNVPAGVRQTIRWTGIAHVARTTRNRLVVTVFADTSSGPYSLAVPVGRGPHGTRRIVAPPAILGAVPIAPGREDRSAEREVEDLALVAVLRRTLRNYLAADGTDLAADLDSTAVVVTPDVPLSLRSVDPPTWVVTGRRVGVTARVRTRAGVELTLRYELAVVRRAGRWLVQAIHINPSREVQP